MPNLTLYCNNMKTKIISLLILLLIIAPVFVTAGIVPTPGDGTPDDYNMEAFATLIYNILEFAVEMGLVFSVIAFAVVGYLYMTSGGDPGKRKQAHGILQKVVVGAIIALSAFLIVKLIVIDAFGLNPKSESGSEIMENVKKIF
jgi:hypothetical protein